MEYLRVRSGVAGGFVWGLLLAGLLAAGWALLPGLVFPASRTAAKTGVAGPPRFAPPLPAEVTPAGQPVAHARNAGARACLNAIDELARASIDTEHTALSTWNPKDADGRLFQSIIGLRYRSEHAPHALSVLVAAPVRAGQPEGQPCDAASIQVHPSQLPCGQISAALEKSAQGQNPAQPAASADLSGLPLVQTGNATRVALIPVKPQGCIVVGVGVYYAR